MRELVQRPGVEALCFCCRAFQGLKTPARSGLLTQWPGEDMGRAFSPWRCFGLFTQADGLGWDRARRWCLLSGRGLGGTWICRDAGRLVVGVGPGAGASGASFLGSEGAGWAWRKLSLFGMTDRTATVIAPW